MAAKKVSWCALFSLIVVWVFGDTAAGQQQFNGLPPNVQFVPDEIIVKFKPGVGKVEAPQKDTAKSSEAADTAVTLESPYLRAVREFADNVLKYGRDTYGPKHTPLFVDGLNIHTHEPVKWISPKGDMFGDVFKATETEEWILSNFASQQTLLRTLDGLSEVTGDPKYREAAMQAVKYAFENLRAPNGLFYWGQVIAYDAQADKVKYVFGNRHSLKVHYPYYELLWQVDPEATKNFIEAFWSAHVIDWSNLDFDRYAVYSDYIEEPWNHDYRSEPIFFRSKKSGAQGAFHAGTNLVQAGTALYRLSGQEQPLVWSKRLMQHFVDTRHPNTGISAYKYNQPQSSFVGRGMKERFADPRTGVFPFHPFPIKRNMYHPEDVKAHQWLSVLLIGDMLGEQGREFAEWAREELTAWGKASYRERDNAFVPILTDGTRIEGVVLEEDGPLGVKGSIAEPLFADAGYFWLYATACRTTGDAFMWRMTRNIANGNDFGDIGETPGQKPELNRDTACFDVYSLLGFLELYNKTENHEFLVMARRIADNIVANQFHGGFFVLSKEHIYTRFDCFEPLALLHLAAAIESQPGSVPRVWPSSPLFVPPYRYKQEGEDRRIIYTLTESSEVPLSLQEAAHIGDIDLVRTLFRNGTKVDSMDDGYGLTALHRAAIAGHKDIAALLITHGARVDHGGYKSTPLHCAIQYGHRDVVELLLDHGADVNIKDNWGRGQTPLDIAIGKNRMDIIKLLLDKGAETISIHRAVQLGDLARVKALVEQGADVNAKDAQGSVPLVFAVKEGRKEIVELLLAHDADMNIKDRRGWTPLDYARLGKLKDIIELFSVKITSLHQAVQLGDLAIVKALLKQGADVNVQNKAGDTPLHCATQPRGIGLEIIELLITKGADVNAKNNDGKTPLDLAVTRNRPAIAKLLIEKGAAVSTIHIAALAGNLEKVRSFIEAGTDVNAKDESGMTPLLRAVSREHAAVVKFLVDNGADLNTGDKWGYVPLVYALWHTDSETVKLLIAKGADVNAKNNDGKTPLDLAVTRNRPAIGELLVAKGAVISSLHAAAFVGDLAKVKAFIDEGVEVNKKNDMGGTALHSAAAGGHKKTAEFLIDKKSEVNAQMRGGQTPLHMAAEGGHLDVAELLLSRGADINAKDRRGRTPLDLAQKAEHKEMVDLLLKQMLVHNVAVANISVPSNCVERDTVPVIVTVENRGGYEETFEVKLTDVTNDKEVASRSVMLSTKDRGAAEADLTFTGENVGDYFGDRQCLDGDLNGDGVNDILIVATGWNDATGRVYLYYGGTNISSTPDLVFQGESTNDHFGDWGAFTADMNKDNIDDLLVCARTYNDRGRAYIFYGGTNMNNVADVIIDPPTADGTGLSYGAPCPGDFNGDNIMDLTVGAADYKNSTGRIYLYYGPVTSGANADKTFTGEGELNRFGRAQAAGDVDNDNCDDLLVMDRYYPDKTAVTSGRAYLYWGASGTSMSTTIGIKFDGEGTAVEMGHNGDILDINNDGFADIVIGSPSYPNSPIDAGRVYLYWGKARGSFTNVPDLYFDGPDGTNSHFGTSARLEYADDDEYADLLVPAYGYYNQDYRGRWYIFYGGPKGGMDTIADHTFTGDTSNFFGWRAELGDVNNDNYGDVLVGGYGYDSYRGRALLWYGGPESSTTQLKFNWDTTNASPGKHTLRAAIAPVAGEEDVADNTVTVEVEVKGSSK